MPWALALYLGSAGAVLGLTVRRLLRSAPLAWAGTAALVAAELVAALALGPLHRRADESGRSSGRDRRMR
jgi:hypothetical protein